jgi:hypothetical protein
MRTITLLIALLNAMENLLQEFRGDVFIIEDGDEE